MMYRTHSSLTRKSSANKDNISSLTSRSWCQLTPSYCPIKITTEDILCATVPCVTWDNDSSCGIDLNDIDYVEESYSSVIDPEVSDMRVPELKKELDAYGVGTTGLFEKSELAEALLDARRNLPRPEIPSVNKKESHNKEEKIRQEMEKVQNMKSSEMRRELHEQFNIHTVFFEKSEYANALAVARVEKALRIKEEEMSKENIPESSTSFFPSLSGISNTVQNMQTISSLLQNSEQLVNNPEVVKIIQKAQTNPKVMAAVMDCMSNPNNITKYQSDPEITMFLNELGKCIQ